MADWLGLDGRKVMVAGGSGTIGRAVVEGFVDAGARVAAIDRDADPLAALAADTGAKTVQADLRDYAAAQAAVAEAANTLGGIDVFVHCVGVNNRKPIEEYSAAEWDEIIAVNLSSAFSTAQAALAPMREQGHGRLIFFSSVAGRSGHRDHGPYAATKAALNQLMRVIANEYAARGITANAVAPGYMRTALTERYLAEHPEYEQQLIGLIPARRFGELDEVVGPVLFLASQHAGFITGQVLYIDGGRTVV
jgi:NAD(P)-dependent dehydrogenase (short-subunit alcohol dehydrogenase family)